MYEPKTPARTTAALIAALAIVVPATLAAAAPPDPYEDAPPYAFGVRPHVRLDPVLTTGQQIDLTDGLPGETYRILGIPDGMGFYRTDEDDHRERLVLLLNHEFNQTAGTPFGTFPSGARASELRLEVRRRHGRERLEPLSGRNAFDEVFDGETGLEIVPDAGIARLCSATLASWRVGFDRPIFLHGEEAGSPGTFDGLGGLAFATFEGSTHTLPRVGRAEWENIVPVPFTGRTTAMIALQDGGTLSSFLFLYVGEKEPGSDDPLAINGLDNGSLFVFVADDSTVHGEVEFATKGESIDGHWVEVDWSDTDVGLNAQAFAAGAFAFTRLEDGSAHPVRPGFFYFDTTGTPGVPSNPFGRLYRLLFDPRDPAGDVRLTLLLDGSEGIVSPDNLDVNRHGEILILEDPNYDLSVLGLERDSSAWLYDTRSRRLTRVAEIDRKTAYDHAIAADPGNSGSTLGTPGSWEFSGVVDAERLLGRGTWLLNIQAHTLRIAPVAETVQGGQILLLDTRRGRH